MKKLLSLTVVSLIVWGSMVSMVSTGSAQGDDTPALVAGSNAFAFDFYRQVTAGSDTNLIFSPFSISQAFAMLMAAARENTERQMADTLHYTLAQDALHPAFAALNTALVDREPPADPATSGEPLQLNIANSIWAQDGFPFQDSYISLLDTFYNGGLRLMDFVGAPEEARETINSWIEDETEDKIQDMIPPGTLGSDTRMVLVNAIYFKGSWLHAFVEGATEDDTFTLLDGSTVTVPMMFLHERLSYLRGENFQAVVLPYAGGDMAMLVLLPDEGQFEAVQSTLDGDQFAMLSATLSAQEMDLYMPRFTFETALDLTESLPAMGMTDVFDGAVSNLTGMFDPAAGSGNLYVSAALHNAFIGVDEAGTEAAAATVIAVAETAMLMPEEVVELRLDRPFIYAIFDRQTGAILFLGQVMNPAE